MGSATTKESTATALTTKDQRRLEKLETIVGNGLAGFAEAGVALREIRDEKLYRSTHSTFEAYCAEAWGLTHRHANRLVEASNVTEVLGPMGPVPTERVARELAPLSDDPGALLAAWERATTEHGSPTAAHVRAIVRGDTPADPPPATPLKALPAPPREPVKSPATLASLSRAFNAALADGWSLEDISEVMDRIIRERAS